MNFFTKISRYVSNFSNNNREAEKWAALEYHTAKEYYILNMFR